jgi:hypothetical protein
MMLRVSLLSARYHIVAIATNTLPWSLRPGQRSFANAVKIRRLIPLVAPGAHGSRQRSSFFNNLADISLQEG